MPISGYYHHLLSKFKSSLGFLAVDLLIMWIDVLTVDFA